MSSTNCFRHGETVARRKCFRCRKPICPSCQLKLSGHIWCGKPCEVKFSIEDRGRRLVAAVHTPLPTSIAVLVTGTLAISLALFVARSVATLSEMGGSFAEIWRKPVAAVPKVAAAEISAVEPAVGGESVNVRGNATDGSLVFLFRGDELVGARLATAGRFRFDGVAVAAAGSGIEFHVGAVLPGSVSPGGSYRFEPLPSSLTPRLTDIVRGDPSRKQLVLSLDAGSHAEGSTEILDVLSRYGIRTTIFLTGEFISKHPDIEIGRAHV